MIRKINVPFILIMLIGTIGLLAPIISNDKALVASLDGQIIFPFIKEHKQTKAKPILRAPITYSNTSIDKGNLRWRSPIGQQTIDTHNSRHWLGTSKLGKDVLAGMIYGCRTATFIGLFSVSLASIIGIFIGMIAGYYGDHQLKLPWWKVIVLTVGILLGFFYFILAIRLNSWPSFFICLMLITGILLIGRLPNTSYGKGISIPIDSLVNKVIEVRRSIPLLYLLLVVSALVDRPSIWTLSIVLALVMWAPFTRHARANTLALRNEAFIDGAIGVGLNDLHILIKYIWPNIKGRLIAIIAFAMSSAILLESTLSFLGLGIPTDQLTWGNMLSEARQNASAWWMAVFPGLAIFLTVLCLNLLGEKHSNSYADS